MNAALRSGATVVTLPGFDPETFLAVMADHGVTYAPLVPPLVLFMVRRIFNRWRDEWDNASPPVILQAKHPVVDAYDLTRVNTVFSGAAPLDAELSKALEARLPAVSVRQGYGMTEMSPVSTLTPPHSIIPGSAGMLVPNAEAKLVCPDSGDILPGDGVSRGELLVRGPHIMQGYLENEAATAATLSSDGWLHSGDIATYDDATGHFYIVDRLKDLIKVKGYQVAPAELEGILHEHPHIADCAVVGVPDEKSGEAPKAFVVLKSGSESVCEGEIREWVASRVAPYKVLGSVAFLDSIPKSASGKILKRQLLSGE